MSFKLEKWPFSNKKTIGKVKIHENRSTIEINDILFGQNSFLSKNYQKTRNKSCSWNQPRKVAQNEVPPMLCYSASKSRIFNLRVFSHN